jgi:hypothetical protein
VGLSAHEADERRRANEERLRDLVWTFRSLAMDPVLVSSHLAREVLLSFLTWADQRLLVRGRV